MTIKVEVIQGGNFAQIEAQLQFMAEGRRIVSVFSHGGRVVAVTDDLDDTLMELVDSPAPASKSTPARRKRVSRSEG
jgi:hypothetical protein